MLFHHPDHFYDNVQHPRDPGTQAPTSGKLTLLFRYLCGQTLSFTASSSSALPMFSTRFPATRLTAEFSKPDALITS